MKIAIHKSKTGFHPRWIAYCEEQQIAYKLVDCYSNDLIEQLKDCNALMWHHSQQNPKDLVIAKQILFALEHTGFKVFPDFNTAWHFDDKVAQKYLLEAIGAPLIPTYIFYNKNDAIEWINKTDFPKVLKLRGGAGSSNVFLLESKQEAEKVIDKAFTKGLPNYSTYQSLRDRWYKYKTGQKGIIEPIKGLLRYFAKPAYSKVLGREFHYVYFQDFIPNLQFDYRTKVVAEKVWGYKRFVRKNDFRASGSGSSDYEYGKNVVPVNILKYSLELANKLKMKSVAFDFVPFSNDSFLLIEISGLFGQDNLEFIGYFDKELNWHEGKFNPQGWMVDSIIKNQ